jgi:translation initiation factor 2 beta subunit (eIF-2beta)/eIF-5
MTTLSTTTSQDELHQAGIDVLSSELGVVGYIRFIQQFNKGSGDYTAERARLHAGKTVDDVMTAIEKARAERERAPKPPVRRARSTTISPDASPDELRGAGLEALRRDLGPTDFVLFLRQLIKPSGDYAAERAKLSAHLSAEEIFEVIDNRPAAEPEPNQGT